MRTHMHIWTRRHSSVFKAYKQYLDHFTTPNCPNPQTTKNNAHPNSNPNLPYPKTHNLILTSNLICILSSMLWHQRRNKPWQIDGNSGWVGWGCRWSWASNILFCSLLVHRLRWLLTKSPVPKALEKLDKLLVFPVYSPSYYLAPQFGTYAHQLTYQ